MMSRHFALSSELTGAIAKRLPHAKNQPSTPGSFLINSLQIYIYIYTHIYTNNNRVLIVWIYIYIQERFALVCAARLADTSYPPEAPFGRLGSHWLIIREITF